MNLPNPNEGPFLPALCDPLLDLLYNYHMKTLDTVAHVLVLTDMKPKEWMPQQYDTAVSVINAINHERSIRAKLRGRYVSSS